MPEMVQPKLVDFHSSPVYVGKFATSLPNKQLTHHRLNHHGPARLHHADLGTTPLHPRSSRPDPRQWQYHATAQRDRTRLGRPPRARRRQSRLSRPQQQGHEREASHRGSLQPTARRVVPVRRVIVVVVVVRRCG